MLNKNNNVRIILRFVGILYATSTPHQLSAIPKHSIRCLTACILTVTIPSFISLYTKGTPKELKFKTELDDSYSWCNCLVDWIEVFKVWNVILKPDTYKKCLSIFWDKRWVGTQLSLIPEEITTKVDNKTATTLTDKKLKCLPTGVCGKFDAYVLKQCKNIFEAMGNMEKALIIYCLLFHRKDIKKFSQLILANQD